MSAALRDVVEFFHKGDTQHGSMKLVEMVSKKLNIKKTKFDLKDIMTHKFKIYAKKTILLSYVIKHLPGLNL